MPTTKPSISTVGKNAKLNGAAQFPRAHTSRHTYNQRSGKSRPKDHKFPAEVKPSPKVRNSRGRPWPERKVLKFKAKLKKLAEQKAIERKESRAAEWNGEESV